MQKTSASHQRPYSFALAIVFHLEILLPFFTRTIPQCSTPTSPGLLLLQPSSLCLLCPRRFPKDNQSPLVSRGFLPAASDWHPGAELPKRLSQGKNLEHHHGAAELAQPGANGPKEKESPAATAYSYCNCSALIGSSQQLLLGDNIHLGKKSIKAHQATGGSWCLQQLF